MYVFMSSGCYFCQILTDTGSCQRILVTISNIRFHENLPGENGSDTWMDTERNNKVTGHFSNCFANSPENSMAFNTEISRSNTYHFLNKPKPGCCG